MKAMLTALFVAILLGIAAYMSYQAGEKVLTVISAIAAIVFFATSLYFAWTTATFKERLDAETHYVSNLAFERDCGKRIR